MANERSRWYGFYDGHPPYGPARVNKSKKLCRQCPKAHPYTHVYTDAGGQEHRWCIYRQNELRRQRKRNAKKRPTIYTGALKWIYAMNSTDNP